MTCVVDNYAIFFIISVEFYSWANVLIMVVGGVIYITSAGNEKRSEMGKNTIKYAVVGIMIALVSLVIIKSLAKIIVNNTP